MTIFDTSKLPFPTKGQIPKAEWFTIYSEALKSLAGVVESMMGDGIQPGMIRFAKTITAGGSYPARSATPNCFPFKFRTLHDYTSTAGNQTVIKRTRHSDSTVADNYVFNLASLAAYRHTAYIPADTDLIIFGLGPKWFCWYEPNPLVHFKSKGSGLTASNSSTGALGSGSCDIYYADSSGTLTDTTVDETVYNPGAAFAANTFGVASYNEAGKLEAIVERC